MDKIVIDKCIVDEKSKSRNRDENTQLCWKPVTDSSGPFPRPRHGHRAVNVKNLIIVFGGGNDGIVEGLQVFNPMTKKWSVPSVKGDIHPGCAAYGIAVKGTRLYVSGGMFEYGKYSGQVYELETSKWEWRCLHPQSPENGSPPCARLGHSFTIVGDRIFLFGGLANESGDPGNIVPKYLNDLYILETQNDSNNNDKWTMPTTYGKCPLPRESHTGIHFTCNKSYKQFLLIYGGMNYQRLRDTWLLDIESMTWLKQETKGCIPMSRSLHTATLISNKMYVFGGWVPLTNTSLPAMKEREWKCTNHLDVLNLDTMTWEDLNLNAIEENIPRARAGHCAVAIESRLYIWSGRDGYRKAWNNQVCCKDLWYLEVTKPLKPPKVTFVKKYKNCVHISWLPTTFASVYELQIQKLSSKVSVAPKSAVQPNLVLTNRENRKRSFAKSDCFEQSNLIKSICLPTSFSTTIPMSMQKNPKTISSTNILSSVNVDLTNSTKPQTTFSNNASLPISSAAKQSLLGDICSYTHSAQTNVSKLPEMKFNPAQKHLQAASSITPKKTENLTIAQVTSINSTQADTVLNTKFTAHIGGKKVVLQKVTGLNPNIRFHLANGASTIPRASIKTYPISNRNLQVIGKNRFSASTTILSNLTIGQNFFNPNAVTGTTFSSSTTGLHTPTINAGNVILKNAKTLQLNQIRTKCFGKPTLVIKDKYGNVLTNRRVQLTTTSPIIRPVCTVSGIVTSAGNISVPTLNVLQNDITLPLTLTKHQENKLVSNVRDRTFNLILPTCMKQQYLTAQMKEDVPQPSLTMLNANNLPFTHGINPSSFNQNITKLTLSEHNTNLLNPTKVIQGPVQCFFVPNCEQQQSQHVYHSSKTVAFAQGDGFNQRTDKTVLKLNTTIDARQNMQTSHDETTEDNHNISKGAVNPEMNS